MPVLIRLSFHHVLQNPRCEHGDRPCGGAGYHRRFAQRASPGLGRCCRVHPGPERTTRVPSSLGPFARAAPQGHSPGFSPLWEVGALGLDLVLTTDVVCYQRQPGLGTAASRAGNLPERRLLTKKHIMGILISLPQVRLQMQIKFFM